MADIKKEEIIHIANLAMLNLTEKEIEGYTKDMQEILEYAEMINSLDTSNINETIATAESNNIFRKDEVENCYDRELLLKNAPSQDEGMFRLPKIV